MTHPLKSLLLLLSILLLIATSLTIYNYLKQKWREYILHRRGIPRIEINGVRLRDLREGVLYIRKDRINNERVGENGRWEARINQGNMREGVGLGISFGRAGERGKEEGGEGGYGDLEMGVKEE